MKIIINTVVHHGQIPNIQLVQIQHTEYKICPKNVYTRQKSYIKPLEKNYKNIPYQSMYARPVQKPMKQCLL